MGALELLNIILPPVCESMQGGKVHQTMVLEINEMDVCAGAQLLQHDVSCLPHKSRGTLQ
jgi:hypothetical protein